MTRWTRENDNTWTGRDEREVGPSAIVEREGTRFTALRLVDGEVEHCGTHATLIEAKRACS